MLRENERDVAGQGPDFRHIDTWIFDLDNTLYRADTDLFAQIEQRMTQFIAQRLDVHPGEAYKLQHMYFRSYGSSLTGLVERNGIDAEEFLAYVHDIDLSRLSPDPRLRPAIERLPGRRYIFTNGCRHHAARILAQVGLDGVMDDVWDIRTLNFRPKPQPEAYRIIVEAGGFDPATSAMFEDTAFNLEPAYALGMRTVWLRNGSRWSLQAPNVRPALHQHIHHEIDDLAEFLHAIRV